jgi:hypothetical protein
MNWTVLAPPRALNTAPPTIRWRLDGKVRSCYRTGLRLTGDIADFGAIFAFIANAMVFVGLVP